jgi:hypothetical protein
VSDPALEGDSDRGMAVVWTGGDFFSESVGDMLEAENEGWSAEEGRCSGEQRKRRSQNGDLSIGSLVRI